MGRRVVVAVTDGDWFDRLHTLPHLTEVNFWFPSDRTFRAPQCGELFLFKLLARRTFIVDGWFAQSTILPTTRKKECARAAGGTAAKNITDNR